MEKVSIPTDSVGIATSLFQIKGGGKHPIIIYLNGKGGLKERFYAIARHFQEKGYMSLCFDFRGRGESQTENTPPFKTQLADFEHVMSYVEKIESFDGQNIIVVATSMGGYVAASLAYKHKGIQKLFLLEPSLLYRRVEKVPYLDIEAEELSVAGFTATEEEIKKLRPIQGVQKYTGDLFLAVHSQSSYKELMKRITQHYYNYAEAAAKREIVPIDAKHAIFKTDEGQISVIRLLEEYL